MLNPRVLARQEGTCLIYGRGDRCDIQDFPEVRNGEIANTNAPVMVGTLNKRGDPTRRVHARGESILLGALEALPNRREVPAGQMDEIHVQLLQSQLKSS